MMMLLAGLASAKELYRAPSIGDQGVYYILKKEKLIDNIIYVLSSRVRDNKEYTDFTELQVNCSTKQYFVQAVSGENGVKDMPSSKIKDWTIESKWTSVVTGSSEYDLVMHVCEQSGQSLSDA
ncbi:MAG: hypothetical protein D3909_06545 [Candidatus Electrothrix sp. ATG1]|nr:hypothetical protein [Candidatus Electrothrix sp. ATG1]